MSFAVILIISSLLVIIPSYFIWRAKKSPAVIATPNPPLAPTPMPTIMVSLSSLPTLFQQMIQDIEAQYAQLEQNHQANRLVDEDFLVSKRLFYTRLPELMQEYARLDPHYAKHHIITSGDGSHQGMTSFDMVHGQLKKILSHFYRANHRSNQHFANNILVNQRYLNQVLPNAVNSTTDLTSGLATSATVTSLPLQDDTFDRDKLLGYQYISSYVTPMPKFITDEIISQLGELLYLASITQAAVIDSFEAAFRQRNLVSNLELEAIDALLRYELPKRLSRLTVATDTKPFCQMMSDTQSLLYEILDTLDKPLPIADKLALVQNLHDDLEAIISQN